MKIFTKQKIIELIKRTSIYPFLKSKLYQTKEEDYISSLLSSSDTNKFITKMILSDKPFIISRLGTTEIGVLKTYEKKKKYIDKQKKIIMQYSGFYPVDDDNLDKFCKLYQKIIPNIDLAGISFIPFENILINKYAPHAKLTKLRNLEPYFYDEPWSQYLQGKKILVIHPFANSIKSQYLKRNKLFQNPKVLPKFELITYQAAQTLGGSDEYSSWFEALEKMENDINKIDFDIAIIGAGVYGLPLSNYIKSIGKSAIHLGGSTQMMFGVYGQRWAIHPDFKNIINDNWVKPSLAETPSSAKNVENACYW